MVLPSLISSLLRSPPLIPPFFFLSSLSPHLLLLFLAPFFSSFSSLLVPLLPLLLSSLLSSLFSFPPTHPHNPQFAFTQHTNVVWSPYLPNALEQPTQALIQWYNLPVISSPEREGGRGPEMGGKMMGDILLQFLKERFKIDVPHRFRPHTFLGPTFCDMCGQLMHGLFRQGVKCEGDSELVVDLSLFCSELSSSDPFPSHIFPSHIFPSSLSSSAFLFPSLPPSLFSCSLTHPIFSFFPSLSLSLFLSSSLPIVCGTNCHRRCEKNMPPLCGVNEKLLAEALKNVDQLKKRRLVCDCVCVCVCTHVYACVWMCVRG